MSTYFDVREHIQTRIPEGALFMPKQLAHLGPRSTVVPLLSFFTRVGLVRRVATGIYQRPYRRGDDVPPPPGAVARLRIEARGEIVQVHGADAAIGFGLDAPPPTGPRFYTSARTGTVHVGGTPVRFRHVPGVVLSFPGTRAGEALAALHFLGAERAAEAVPVVRAQVPVEDRHRLRSLLPRLSDRVVNAWLAVDPSAAPALGAPVA